MPEPSSANATLTMSLGTNPCTTETVNLAGTLTATTEPRNGDIPRLAPVKRRQTGFTLVAAAPSAVTTTVCEFPDVGRAIRRTLRTLHAAGNGTLLQDGTILITGGEDAGGQVNTAEIYNSSRRHLYPDQRHSRRTNMNIARSQHTALCSATAVLITLRDRGRHADPVPTAWNFTILGRISLFSSAGLATARTGHSATRSGRCFRADGRRLRRHNLSARPRSTSFRHLVADHDDESAESGLCDIAASGNVLITGGFHGESDRHRR